MKVQAIVKRKRRIRPGRGFSRAELKEVNLSVREALKLGIPVDVRRSTKHDENIEILKSLVAENPQAEKSSKAAKPAEK
jgi:large subunit ribosomal protein L13e